MANAGPASVRALVSLWTIRETMRSLESCFTSPSGHTWLCQLRIGDGAKSYHAIFRWAPLSRSINGPAVDVFCLL